MADIELQEVSKAAEKGRWERFRESDFYWKFTRSPVAMISFAVTLVLVLSAVFAPLIAPYDPFDPGSLNLMNGFSAPGVPNAFTGDTFMPVSYTHLTLPTIYSV